MSEAARGYAAAIEHGSAEIHELETQLETLEQQLNNLNATPSEAQLSLQELGTGWNRGGK